MYISCDRDDGCGLDSNKVSFTDYKIGYNGELQLYLTCRESDAVDNTTLKIQIKYLEDALIFDKAPLSGGEIAGIVIGSVASFILVVVAVVYCAKKDKISQWCANKT